MKKAIQTSSRRKSARLIKLYETIKWKAILRRRKKPEGTSSKCKPIASNMTGKYVLSKEHNKTTNRKLMTNAQQEYMELKRDNILPRYIKDSLERNFDKFNNNQVIYCLHQEQSLEEFQSTRAFNLFYFQYILIQRELQELEDSENWIGSKERMPLASYFLEQLFLDWTSWKD